jgi:hexosaminidase
MQSIIPHPVSVTLRKGTFSLTPTTVIRVVTVSTEIQRIAQFMAERLRPATGFPLPVQASDGKALPGAITLELSEADSDLGSEGYELRIEPEGIRLSAPQPAGLFYAVQTLRQLLPASVELTSRQPGPWELPAIFIRDQPRFAWRGAMLDVARHFFGPAVIMRYLDQLAYYKFNSLHLHLTDDQGWRLMIRSRPRLAEHGGSLAVGGSSGGFYTQAEYTEIVEYARERFITIVPEVDMPGHTNAVLASYPELYKDHTAPGLYTGTEVGFSSLAIYDEDTYQFLEDVIREIVELTPGPYFHIGGDEAKVTPEPDFVHFIERVQPMIEAHGKTCVGWEDIAKAKLLPKTVIQHWSNQELIARAVGQGCRVIMSPATRTYLDIKYDPSTKLGLFWTGKYNEVQDSYEWDPLDFLDGAPEETILGVEAPIWTETLLTTADLDSMLFPRLPAIAEIGWTPARERSWEDYRLRLAAHGPRMEAMGIQFHRSPQIEWD